MMRDEIVEALVAGGESDTVELFSGENPQRVIRTIAAMANGQGGTIVIRDADVARLEEAIDSAASQLRPRPAFAITRATIGGQSCVVVEVPRGAEVPYMSDSAIYVRRNAQTVSATADDVVGFVSRRLLAADRWERMPALGVDIEDLDREEIEATAEAARERYTSIDASQPERTLESLGLAGGGTITNAAVLLFGEQPARWFPQIRVRAAHFASEARDHALDDRMFEGNLFRLIADLELFVRSNVAIAAEVRSGSMSRQDRPVYPYRAVREGIINALVHRDYSAYDGGVSLSIFSDRIEIRNVGSLPEGLTVEKLRTPHLSRPHNPDVAHVCFLRGVIDRWGSGTVRIIDDCRAAGLPEPTWVDTGGEVILTMRNGTRATKRVTLNERQLALLQTMKPGDTIDLAKYREQHDSSSERTARNDLAILTKRGYLERRGAGPVTRYIRTNKDVES